MYMVWAGQEEGEGSFGRDANILQIHVPHY